MNCESASERAAEAKRNGIVIYTPYASFDKCPTLQSCAAFLVQRGYKVAVFSHSDAKTTAPVGTTLVDLGSLRLGNPHASTFLRLAYMYWRILNSVRLGARFRAIIAVDAAGLVHTWLLRRIIGARLVYCSLELLLHADLTGFKLRLLKFLETAISRRAVGTIVQDKGRGGLLARENGIPLCNMIYIPNAPLGRPRRRRSEYWHRRFGLSSDKKIVLHAGNIDAWTGILEVISSTPLWPEPWVLVVHCHHERAEDSDEIRRLRACGDPRRVFFSLKPVDRGELETLFDGADVGAAIYDAMPDTVYASTNISCIGLSSGKMAYYLRAGVPIITNKNNSVASLIEETGCGLAVKCIAEDFGAALSVIDDHLAGFSKRACEAFSSHFDPDAGLKCLLAKIGETDQSAGNHKGAGFRS